jgi:hypothetical protein
MSGFGFQIPAIGFISNQLVGGEVKKAIRDCLFAGFEKFDKGDELGATADFCEATAIVMATCLAIVYMAGEKTAIRGLGPVFKSLSSQKSLVAKLLVWIGSRARPGSWLSFNLNAVQVAKLENWGASTAVGYGTGWWIYKMIEATKNFNLGIKIYDWTHVEALPSTSNSKTMFAVPSNQLKVCM